MELEVKEKFDYSQYAKNMRLKLSDHNIICKNGDINHPYFLVKKGAYWSEKH